MTDFKALIREGAEASQLMAPGDARGLIARLTAALEEAHEVAVGADHTAAKYWRRMVERDQEAHAAQVRVVDLERDLTVAEAGVKRAQAEALREAAESLNERFQDIPAWTEVYREGVRTDEWMQGGVRMTMSAIQVLRDRADQFEKEAGA